MKFSFNYPKIRQLTDNRLYNEILTSSTIINNDVNIKLCNVIVTIYKKINKINGKIYARNYYTHEELKLIILNLFNKRKYLELNVIDWEFSEKISNNCPEIHISIMTIGDLECQHLMLKKKLKNITLQLKNLNQCGKKQKMQSKEKI